MATGYNEYFTDVLDTLNKYQDRHGKRFSIKKIKEAVLCFMDEEEEEIKRNISDYKEGDDDISDFKEGVDDISDSKERVDGISDSDEWVDAEREEKAYRDYIFRNEFETMICF